jgi:predicted RNA binding protein YcfA (HicA-like mRNA interferase family)
MGHEVQRTGSIVRKRRFRLVKEKGSIRYYSKSGLDRLIRIDYHGSKEVPTGTGQAILRVAGLRVRKGKK